MPYQVFTTKTAADDRSRQAWAALLGRAKRAEDVTEFLWARTRPGLNGSVAVVIPPPDSSRLTQQERNKLTESLDPLNWLPVSILL
jgi:hypothetical protein